ncbi:hypothetical protein R3P38DRAFT_3282836 [Favolaschia claudopus]|uniref:Uncharacterized protein n=1 Tax=Favolaschia claudopus TaxID=2862362 RepID=A0AAW0A997_9AGAR
MPLPPLLPSPPPPSTSPSASFTLAPSSSPTALALLLSASYLALPTLYAKVSACIITEMAHALFHAASPSPPTRSSPAAHGGAGGCTCRKCAGRVPRILDFALRDDVKDAALERGSRRALVGLFGTGRRTQEFSASRQRDALGLRTP